jgi:hypothetical protein
MTKPGSCCSLLLARSCSSSWPCSQGRRRGKTYFEREPSSSREKQNKKLDTTPTASRDRVRKGDIQTIHPRGYTTCLMSKWMSAEIWPPYASCCGVGLGHGTASALPFISAPLQPISLEDRAPYKEFSNHPIPSDLASAASRKHAVKTIRKTIGKNQGSTTQIKPVCMWFCRPDVTNQSGVLSGS